MQLGCAFGRQGRPCELCCASEQLFSTTTKERDTPQCDALARISVCVHSLLGQRARPILESHVRPILESHVRHARCALKRHAWMDIARVKIEISITPIKRRAREVMRGPPTAHTEDMPMCNVRVAALYPHRLAQNQPSRTLDQPQQHRAFAARPAVVQCESW
jgi:hypothetical protein